MATEPYTIDQLRGFQTRQEPFSLDELGVFQEHDRRLEEIALQSLEKPDKQPEGSALDEFYRRAEKGRVRQEVMDKIDASRKAELRPIMQRAATAQAELIANAHPDFESADEIRRLQILNEQRAEFGLHPVARAPEPESLGEAMGRQFGTAEGLARKIPFVGSGLEAGEMLSVYEAAQRAGSDKASVEDWEILASFQERLAREQRGGTVGGNVTNILSESLPFMGEFLASGGVLSVAKKAAFKGGKKAATLAVKTGVAAALKRGIVGAGKMAVGSAARAPFFFERIRGATIRGMLPDYLIGVDDDQELDLFIAKPGKSMKAALGDAAVDTYVEIFSEQTGKAIALVTAPVRNIADKVLPIRIGVRDFLERAGFHGVIGEMGEERIGELMREAATRMGIADLPQQVPTGRQLGEEGLAFGVMAGGGTAASAVLDAADARARAKSLRDLVTQSPAAARQMIASEPLRSAAIAALGTPTRKEMKDLLPPLQHLNAEDRALVSKFLRAEMEVAPPEGKQPEAEAPIAPETPVRAAEPKPQPAVEPSRPTPEPTKPVPTAAGAPSTPAKPEVTHPAPVGGAAAIEPPAPVRHSIGDKQSISGHPARVVDVTTVEGIDYEVYAHDEGGGGSIRVLDVDSGNPVTIKNFKTLGEAFDAATDAVEAAHRGGEKPEPADDVADHDVPTAEEEFQAATPEDATKNFPTRSDELTEAGVPLPFQLLMARRYATDMVPEIEEKLRDVSIPDTMAIYQSSSIEERGQWEDLFLGVIQRAKPKPEPPGSSRGPKIDQILSPELRASDYAERGAQVTWLGRGGAEITGTVVGLEDGKPDTLIVQVPGEGFRRVKNVRGVDEVETVGAVPPPPKPTPPGDLVIKPIFGGPTVTIPAEPPPAVPAPPAESVPMADDRKKDQTEPELTETQKADRQLANVINEGLRQGVGYPAKGFFGIADSIYGGTRAEGKYGPSEAYDALEAGVNLSLVGSTPPTTTTPKGVIANLQEIIGRVPSQTNRSGDKDVLQQFSTPPAYAFAVNWLANITTNDVVLEPSAGTGSLAVHARNTGATVFANEISDRRADLLDAIVKETVFREDAEQIHNILPGKMPAPNVVVMNPPFSHAGTRLGSKTIPGMDLKHVEAALKLMADGGRLVAITGAPLHGDETRTFRRWADRIKKVYNLRANVLVGRNAYKGYGTTFPTRVLIIDKTGPSTSDVARTEADTLDSLVDQLEAIRNDRTHREPQPQSLEPQSSAPSATGVTTEPGTSVRPPTGVVGAGGSAAPDSGAGRPVRTGTEPTGGGDVELRPGERPELLPRPGGVGGASAEGELPVPGDRPTGETGRPGRGGGVSGGEVSPKPTEDNAEPAPRDTDLELEEATESSRQGDLSDVVFEPYVPSVKVKGGKKHPASIAESAAMASVRSPQPKVLPDLPKDVLESGALSDLQFEQIALAESAHSEMLPSRSGETAFRRGYMIGDGTGVGKGREIAGIILSNWRQGRKKAVWVTVNQDLFKTSRGDWQNIGQDPKDIFKPPKYGQPINASQGIMYTSYATVAKDKGEDKGLSRVNQIVDWFGADYDGVIAFDESHKMGNVLAVKKARGKSKPSQMALAAVDLQRKLPNARIVYVSATAATEVTNLAYAMRLGLWGRGTPFANVQEFVAQISSGGVAAMEMVARDMKALGLYSARSISFNDGTPEGTVQYDRLEHTLTPEQVEVYDELALAWQVVLKDIGRALDVSEAGGKARGAATSVFWGNNQRFFNQIITAMQLPSAMALMKQDLARGMSVVVQLTNTHEAAQNRELAKRALDEDLEDFDLTPRESLIGMVEKSFPVFQYETTLDQDGNEVQTLKVDKEGNPVENQEAVAIRDALLDRLASIRVPDSPLDALVREFGPENVAEITGRKQRVARLSDAEGTVKNKLDKRSDSIREKELSEFRRGKRRMLIFSEKGGTGASYHAGLDIENQQMRRHYLLQAGWSAHKAIQGLGRTHRSNQKQAPGYVLVNTNLKGQKRFLSTIARRLAQLGALTRGQRTAGSTGLFDESDNLESTEAKKALRRFYELMQQNQADSMTLEDYQDATGLKLRDETGNAKTTLPTSTQFMNRLLSMTVAQQNAVFGEFEQIHEQVIGAAKERGELDLGMEVFKADSIKKIDERTVYVAPGSEAKTNFVQFDAKHKARRLSWRQLQVSFKPREFVRSNKGTLYASLPSGNVTTDSISGDVHRMRKLVGITGATQIEVFKLANTKIWEKIDADQAEALWNEHFERTPKFNTSKVNLITGVVLPIWDRLGGKTRIFRLQTDAGEVFLGRVIPEALVGQTLQALGAEAGTGENAISSADAVRGLYAKNITLTLVNGWRLRGSQVQNEKRIELTGPDFKNHAELDGTGLFKERISSAMRYFIPVGDNAVEVYEALTEDHPVAKLDYMRQGNAAEQAMREADEELGGLGIVAPGILGGKSRRPGVSLPEAAQFPDSVVEERMTEAHGVPRVPALSKLAEIATDAWHIATRARKHIPNSEEFAVANEVLRLWGDTPQVVADDVHRRVAAMLNDMGKGELPVFERVIQAENIIASMQKGMGLPFGIKSEKEILDYKDKLDAIVNVPENVAIRSALKTRKKIVNELVLELVRNDILPTEALDSAESYYHQQVMGYAQLQAFGKRGLQRKKASFQKRRTKVRDEDTDPFYDYNTSFIEAETKWMTEARAKLKAEEALRTLAKRYDKSKSLKAAATRINYVNFVGGEKNMTRINDIRELLAEPELDPSERAILHDELETLDPTQPFRQKIARLSSRIMEMLSDGTIDTAAFDDLRRPDEDVDDLDARWFELLRFTATRYDGQEPGNAALGIFKALNDRAQMIASRLGDKARTWEDFIPDTHLAWQPQAGNVFYRAYTIPEKIAEEIIRNEQEELKLAPDQVKIAIAMGGRRPSYVMPRELVLQLQDMEKAKPRGALANASGESMKMWKVWTLMNHKRVIPYNIRNFTGDIDPVIGGAVGVLPYMPAAIKELAGYYYGNKLSMSPRLKAAIEHGVLSATMRQQELPKLKDLAVFRRFYNTKIRLRDLPTRAGGAYFDTVGRFTEFREAITRLAAFNYAMDRFEAGKEIVHAGGAKSGVLRALREEMGNEVAAAHYSRNLLGDYGNLTVMGTWMRKHAIPFYSFQEINAKRYPRMAINAVEWGRVRGKGSKFAQGVLAGGALAMLATPLAILWVFNNLIRGDEEDDLGEFDQRNPHVNMGRYSTGEPRIFRNVGALGDFMELWGLNTLGSLQGEYMRGELTGASLLGEMAKDPLNKLYQGLRPDLKGLDEIVSGLTRFPDATSPRRQPRGEVVPRAFGLVDEYRMARRWLLQDGSRRRKYYADRHLWGVTDHRQNALFAMYAARDKWLKKEGKGGRQDTIFGVSAFRNMRQAGIQEDYGAFKEARAAYLAASPKNGYDNFRRSLAHIDPISQKLGPEDERKFEEDLTDRQRLRLKLSRDYAKELEVRLWHWWNRTAEEEGGDSAAEQAQAVHREMRPKLRTLSRNKPLKIDKRRNTSRTSARRWIT